MDHRVIFGERVAAQLQAFGDPQPVGPLKDLIATLVAHPEDYRRKNGVLAELRKTLKACKAFSPSEKEALVTSLEAVLDILQIESSDGLLNEWLQGISL